MKVTAIQVQQKKKERYNIFIDETYRFSADEEVVARFHLLKGREITEAEITEIEQADMLRTGLNKAIHFLSHRVRSEKEVREFLKKQEIENDQIEVILEMLVDRKYLDDEEFALLFVRTQIKTTLKGPKTIERELIEKGISKEIIERVMATYSEEAQFENGRKAAEKIMRRSKKMAKRNIIQKIVTDLIQKGYGTDDAKAISAEVVSELDTQEEDAILAEQFAKAVRKNSRHDPKKAKQKIIQSLMQKGFSYHSIQGYLMEHPLEEEE
ncbi:recombination regulator RecX [Listeria grayi]|uniref:Regulatory protein RecX n=1 Tax=Listeria grayi DSM 20601 TaxID=525367 RepID=D7UU36_LISGR|nr:recombination regulator RecX [Listeria grayi]EFI85284.1 regulatory protein RecX [Listeria grayi DSM 20601]